MWESQIKVSFSQQQWSYCSDNCSGSFHHPSHDGNFVSFEWI